MNHRCQQFQLYAAEAIGGGDLVTPSALQLYVDELRERPYWERNFPQVLKIEAYCDAPRSSVGSAGAWYPEKNTGLIEMAPQHMSQQLILHEVAHVLADARYGSRSHDPWFARTYLELVYEVLGSETYGKLVAAFDEHGVDYRTEGGNPAGVEL